MKKQEVIRFSLREGGTLFVGSVSGRGLTRQGKYLMEFSTTWKFLKILESVNEFLLSSNDKPS